MDELIARIEAASGPDRELDAQIARTVGVLPAQAAKIENGYAWDGGLGYDFLHYTAGVDAALSLVPDGFDWTLGHTNGGLTIHAEVGGRGDEYVRFGATPALALCAAALRARQS